MINNSMNYCTIYHSLISRAKNRTKHDGLYESHHVIPRSLGGSNDPSNLALLTPKEHFVAHHLLTKMYTGAEKSKMLYAFWWMAKTIRGKGVRVSANTYARAKEDYIAAHPNRDAERKQRVKEKRDNGEYKYDYSKVSHTLKCTLSALSPSDMALRMKHSTAKANQEERATAIRKGKASILQLTKVDGSISTIYSYECDTVIGLSWSQVKYRISAHNGLLPNGDSVIILSKYTGGNKWKKK